MVNIRILFSMFVKLNMLLNRCQKKRSIIVLLSILLAASFETIGVSIVVPFVTAILSPEDMMKNKYMATILNVFNIDSSGGMLLILGISIILVFIIKNGYLVFSRSLQAKYQCRIQRELSTTMLTSYMKRPYTYFLNINSADILRGVDGDISGVYSIISNLLMIVSETLTMAFIGIFIIIMDPYIAIGVLVISCLCILVTVLAFKQPMKASGDNYREAISKRYMYACQAANGIKEITVMQRKENFIKKYNQAYQNAEKAQVTYLYVTTCPERIIETVFVGALILIICIRAFQGATAIEYIPNLAAFAVAAFRLLPSINKMSSGMTQLVYYRPSLEAAYENIMSAKQYENTEENVNTKLSQSFRENKKMEFKEKISIENIFWKYNKNGRYILDDLSMTIRKGESIALIGESGAGKTTLADVILGLFKPEKGMVEADNFSIFSDPLGWAKTIGYVPQSVYLTDDTIKANISFGLLDEEVDEELMWKALEQAQLKEFVEGLPEGIDTIVGERGVKFSGGQRQRVAIARALYHDPDILVLDEATSALDNETESAVMEAINTLQGKKTLIIVAHRLSTIQNCDKVYEVKEGKVIERRKEEIIK